MSDVWIQCTDFRVANVSTSPTTEPANSRPYVPEIAVWGPGCIRGLARQKVRDDPDMWRLLRSEPTRRFVCIPAGANRGTGVEGGTDVHRSTNAARRDAKSMLGKLAHCLVVAGQLGGRNIITPPSRIPIHMQYGNRKRCQRQGHGLKMRHIFGFEPLSLFNGDGIDAALALAAPRGGGGAGCLGPPGGADSETLEEGQIFRISGAAFPRKEQKLGRCPKSAR